MPPCRSAIMENFIQVTELNIIAQRDKFKGRWFGYLLNILKESGLIRMFGHLLHNSKIYKNLWLLPCTKFYLGDEFCITISWVEKVVKAQSLPLPFPSMQFSAAGYSVLKIYFFTLL